MLKPSERELKEKKLAVRYRKTGKVEKLTREELVKMIKKEVGDKPFRPLPLPMLLTKRPTFIG